MNSTIDEIKKKIVTIIGSMKFYMYMLGEERRLTNMGYIVLHPVDCDTILNDDLKRTLEIHIRDCITLADIVYVMNVDGYIGESTQSEIEFAEDAAKKITYYQSRVDYSQMLTQPDYYAEHFAIVAQELQYVKVALIGSYRYHREFSDISKILTHLNYLVLEPVSMKFSKDVMENFSKTVIDRIHCMQYSQLMEADAVLVIDGFNCLDAHIGDDTTRELTYMKSKCPSTPIYFTSDRGYDKLITHFHENIPHRKE